MQIRKMRGDAEAGAWLAPVWVDDAVLDRVSEAQVLRLLHQHYEHRPARLVPPVYRTVVSVAGPEGLTNVQIVTKRAAPPEGVEAPDALFAGVVPATIVTLSDTSPEQERRGAR